MYTIAFKRAGTNGRNQYIIAECLGFKGIFRFFFADSTRKNARYSNFVVKEVYFERTGDDTHSTQIDIMTNVMLFIERKRQWIFDKAQSEDIFTTDFKL